MFPMLTDPGGRIGRCYGVFDDEKKKDARGCFIIDPRGVVQAVEIMADPAGRNVTDILRRLRALRHFSETGDYLPCGWEPGKPTLPRDPEAAGVEKSWETRHAF